MEISERMNYHKERCGWYMSEFKVKTGHVRAAAGEQNEIARQMKQLEDEIWQIQSGLSFEIAQKQQIRQRLKNTRNTVSSQSKGIYDAAKALNQIADTYETTEAKLAGNQVKKPNWEPLISIADILDVIPEVFPGGASVLPDMVLPLVKPGLLTIIGENIKPDFKTKFEWEKSVQDNKDKTWYSQNKEGLEGSNIGVDKMFEKKWESESSLYRSDVTYGEKDGNYYHHEIELLKQEMHADLYGGLFYTDPETGEKKLRMAAGVSLGYTMTALSIEQEAGLGNENFGVYSKIEGTFGKVEAKADATAGLYDADGKWNPNLYAKVSGEAIIAEVSGKAGVNVLGADVGVEAAVNFGIGAHAEFGYKDGKFSMDIGASLGLGGSVKLEVDIGGMVDAVKGKVTEKWTKFMDIFH
ncbi:MAG: hypothetical protein OSJ62_00960 [Lachnospiraceae bacterium]|nr:hypothetical protein [Lachnospiraceae bacterium]